MFIFDLRSLLKSGKTFGQVIQEARKEFGWAQKEIAAKCGVDPVYISQIENNPLKIPSIKVVMKLALALEIEPRGLLLFAEWRKAKPEYRHYIEELIGEYINQSPGYTVDGIPVNPSIIFLIRQLIKLNLKPEQIVKILTVFLGSFIQICEILEDINCK